MENRVIFCSDVHLCHADWYGLSSEDRMERMIRQLNKLYEERPYDKIIFLGDYSLDFWEWDICGSWLNHGISNTAAFVERYAARLKAPYYMVPGNHEQYGHARWRSITGTDRESCFVAGGYLIIACDNFSGLLDPDHHSDGCYSETRLDFIRQKLAEYPELPVILCAHFFDLSREPEAFFDLIRQEKRIVCLLCGHDHVAAIQDLGEKADHVVLCHDGHFSYSGGKNGPRDCMWGFCEAVLGSNGVTLRYLEPENDYTLEDQRILHPAGERLNWFAPRRDL